MAAWHHVSVLLLVFAASVYSMPLDDVQQRSPDKHKDIAHIVVKEATLKAYLRGAAMRIAAFEHAKMGRRAIHFLDSMLRRLRTHNVHLTVARARFILHRALKNSIAITEQNAEHLALILSNKYPHGLKPLKKAIAKKAVKKAAKKAQAKKKQAKKAQVKKTQAKKAAKKATKQNTKAHTAAKKAQRQKAKAVVAKVVAAHTAAKAAVAKAVVKGKTTKARAKVASAAQHVANIARAIINYIRAHLHVKRSPDDVTESQLANSAMQVETNDEAAAFADVDDVTYDENAVAQDDVMSDLEQEQEEFGAEEVANDDSASEEHDVVSAALDLVENDYDTLAADSLEEDVAGSLDMEELAENYDEANEVLLDADNDEMAEENQGAAELDSLFDETADYMSSHHEEQ